LKVLILSICTKEHAYLIRRIRDAFPDTVVVKIGGPNPSVAPAEKRPERDRPSLARQAREAIVDWIGTLRRRSLERRLFPPGEDSSIAISRRVPDPNTAEAEEKMRALEPAVVVAFGAPILKAGLLSLGTHATVNVHLGIPPKYRGNYTIFWALKQRDYDHVGACLHHIAPGVDSGNVLAEAFPALSRWSTDIDATVGAIRLISTATVDFLKFVEAQRKSPKGTPQTGESHNYKGADRTLSVALAYVLQRALPGGGPAPREDRVVVHY
jgi:methionyl-tRNA formyltransferase